MLSTHRHVLRTALVFLFIGATSCTALKRCAYEGFNRDEWQHPAQVISSLNIQPGDHVADLGSGSGYFTFRLAEAVGSNGKVFAVDVDEAMNTLIAEQARKEGIGNIQVILAKPDDPLLQDGGIDLIFTCNTYHHLHDRISYFTKVGKFLRRNGRIAVIDFNGEGWWQQLEGHWTSSDAITREMKEAGYSLEREFQFLPKQVFLIFSRTQS
ncbi:MAG: class I SAM-dependent methyltransferase [Nitrospiraceae bacterium]